MPRLPYQFPDAISIHAPERGATKISAWCVHHSTNFNPRPRAGSDVSSHTACQSDESISIHAPERGATVDRTVDDSDITISIHAPERGATFRLIEPPEPTQRFQSTPPSGERPSCLIVQQTCPVHISIHAPERGATHDRRFRSS